MLPLNSALLIKPSLLVSSPIVTMGAPGTPSCRRAASLTGPAPLPAASTMLAVDTKSVLSAVGLNFKSTKPANSCAALKVITWATLPEPVTLRVSPAAAPAGKLTRTPIVLSVSSALLMNPSLLPSVVMLMPRPV